MSYFLTQCPFCQTSFKVSEDQMHAANGVVRCGSCMEVFLAGQHRIILKEKAAQIDQLIREYDAAQDRVAREQETDTAEDQDSDIPQADDSQESPAAHWDDDPEYDDEEASSDGTDIDWDDFDEPAFGDGLTDTDPEDVEEDPEHDDPHIDAEDADLSDDYDDVDDVDDDSDFDEEITITDEVDPAETGLRDLPTPEIEEPEEHDDWDEPVTAATQSAVTPIIEDPDLPEAYRDDETPEDAEHEKAASGLDDAETQDDITPEQDMETEGPVTAPNPVSLAPSYAAFLNPSGYRLKSFTVGQASGKEPASEEVNEPVTADISALRQPPSADTGSESSQDSWVFEDEETAQESSPIFTSFDDLPSDEESQADSMPSRIIDAEDYIDMETVIDTPETTDSEHQMPESEDPEWLEEDQETPEEAPDTEIANSHENPDDPVFAPADENGEAGNEETQPVVEEEVIEEEHHYPTVEDETGNTVLADGTGEEIFFSDNSTTIDDENDNTGEPVFIDVIESGNMLTALPTDEAANDIKDTNDPDPDAILGNLSEDQYLADADDETPFTIPDTVEDTSMSEEDEDPALPEVSFPNPENIPTLIPDQVAMEAIPVRQDSSPIPTRLQTPSEDSPVVEGGWNRSEPDPEADAVNTDKSHLLANLSALRDEQSLDPVAPDSLQSIREELVELVSFHESRKGLKTAALLITSALLLATLAGQYAWYNLDQLVMARQWPLLTRQLCQFLSCPDPDALDLSALVTEELVVRSHPEADNALQVDFIFRNDAPREQPFPLVELNFTDNSGSIMASRAFTSREYLPQEMILFNRMPAHSSIQISLSLVDPGPEATGYALVFRSP